MNAELLERLRGLLEYDKANGWRFRDGDHDAILRALSAAQEMADLMRALDRFLTRTEKAFLAEFPMRAGQGEG